MGKLVGSTAPNLPPPPPDKKNCITLIIVAIAVVVACVVAPYMAGVVAGMGLTGTATTVVAGGLTAAAANVASQAVGIVAGVQDGMNWKSVAKAALGGAIGAGIGSLTGLTSSSFVNATLNNIASQVVLIAAHQQEKFSWASVAAAAVSAGVGNSEVVKGITKSMADNGWSAFAQGAVKSGLSQFVGSLTTDLIIPGKQDWAQIGIATFQGALATGLEEQRQYNILHNKPFLFDDMLSTAGKTAGRALRSAFGNALGSSFSPADQPQRGAQAAAQPPPTEASSTSSSFVQAISFGQDDSDMQSMVDHYFSSGDKNNLVLGRGAPLNFGLALDTSTQAQAAAGINLRPFGDTHGYSTYWGLTSNQITRLWAVLVELHITRR